MTIKQFIKIMGQEYEKLYNAPGETPGERIAVYAFDEWITKQENKELLRAVAEERHDIITSDREAAAFMFALEKAGAI